MPQRMGGGFGWGVYAAASNYFSDGRQDGVNLGNTYGTYVKSLPQNMPEGSDQVIELLASSESGPNVAHQIDSDANREDDVSNPDESYAFSPIRSCKSIRPISVGPHNVVGIVVRVTPDVPGIGPLAPAASEDTFVLMSREVGRLDTSAYSVGYVAGWSHCDAETVKATVANVRRAAHTMADSLTTEAEAVAA